MSLGKRETLLMAFDRLALRLATRRYGLFGSPITYQPLPWLGLVEGLRAKGSQQRLAAILRYLDDHALKPDVSVDVGANIGFFSLSLAERGAIAYAVEGGGLNLRIASIAERRVPKENGGRFVPIGMWCDPDNMQSLPECNVSLCLSIWHHWVRYRGLTGATGMLETLLRKTSSALFFDTGENEMPATYNLPFQGADAKQWLVTYLRGLPGARAVECLGQFPAFMPMADEETGNVIRNLFVVEK
jgi:hypothetical protein